MTSFAPIHIQLATIMRALPAGPLNVLEAGCGSMIHLPAHISYRAKVTGIDISGAQLARNRFISECIQGDLQTFDYGCRRWNVVICWDVIEHLPDPHAALRRLFDVLAPGGLLILGYPNLLSAKGLITKFTPHWFHVFYYRCKHAGRGSPRQGPFPTYLRWCIRPRAVERLARRHGLRLLHNSTYHGQSRHWPVICLQYVLHAVSAVLSLGLLTAGETLHVFQRLGQDVCTG